MVRRSDPKRVIAEGYDRMGSDFDEWNAQLPSEGRRWFMDEVLRRLREGSIVLELGCGPGTDAVPLSQNRRYVGLDLSLVQLQLARQKASTGLFVCGDLTTVAFRPSSFDAIIAFYVFNHVPRDEVQSSFASSFEWLRPGGYLMLAGLPTFPDEDRVHEWLGVPMFFGGIEPGEFDHTLREGGFEIDMSELRFGRHEDWGWSEPLWIIARKPH
jgi:cyclopropane fatty-acyl-phospholipid synthase-like methyltransferase